MEFTESQFIRNKWQADTDIEGLLPGGGKRVYISRVERRRRAELFVISYMIPAVGERLAPAPRDQAYPSFEIAERAAQEWIAELTAQQGD